MEIERGSRRLSLPLSRVVVPLPAARRPTATDGFVFSVKQFTNERSQAART